MRKSKKQFRLFGSRRKARRHRRKKTTVIPLSKVSVGYVGGQGNALKNDKKASDVDAGGFGMSVTPVGILIAGEKTTYVGVDKNYTEDKWINLLKTVADTVRK
ncbi:MAG: GerW family sporulation protein [Clostridium sp.]|nr:MAG: GerW family sporulation protein [Clostridium sp.]